MGMDWIKLYTGKWLYGSGRTMTAEQRGVWADLLALAGETKFRDGTLRFDTDKPIPRSYISSLLRISLELLDTCLDIFSKDLNSDDGKPRISIWEDGTIELTNFERFQEVPDPKKKLTGRELELAERQSLNRLASKHPVEAANVPEVKKLLEGEAEK